MLRFPGILALLCACSLSKGAGAAEEIGPQDEPSVSEQAMEPYVRSWREWALLDPFSSESIAGVGIGVVEERTNWQLEARRGLSVELGGLRTTQRGWFFASLRQAFAFRALQRAVYVLNFSEYTLHGGLALGPIRIGSGIGVSPFGFGLSNGDPILEVVSPRASLLASVDTGAIHVGLRGYVQYLIRPIGESAVARGVTLDISLERSLRAERPKRFVPYRL